MESFIFEDVEILLKVDFVILIGVFWDDIFGEVVVVEKEFFN